MFETLEEAKRLYLTTKLSVQRFHAPAAPSRLTPQAFRRNQGRRQDPACHTRCPTAGRRCCNFFDRGGRRLCRHDLSGRRESRQPQFRPRRYRHHSPRRPHRPSVAHGPPLGASDTAATSDFDAVRLLRNAGIDPFQANSVLELVSSGDGPPMPPTGSRALTVTPGGDGVQLPQTIKPIQLPSTEEQIGARIWPRLARSSAAISSATAPPGNPARKAARLGKCSSVCPRCWRRSPPSPRRSIQTAPNSSSSERCRTFGPQLDAERLGDGDLAGFDHRAGLSAKSGLLMERLDHRRLAFARISLANTSTRCNAWPQCTRTAYRNFT